MLSIQTTINGVDEFQEGLTGLARDLPMAFERGLTRIAKGTHREAFAWLSGPGRPQVRMTDRRKHGGRNKTSMRGQASSLGARPGSYPVPVLTGTLRRLLDWLKPGESKGGFQAGANEIVVYDSAEYAAVIHDSEGTSSGFGHRRFLEDGFAKFNQGAMATTIMDQEIDREIKRKGFN